MVSNGFFADSFPYSNARKVIRDYNSFKASIVYLYFDKENSGLCGVMIMEMCMDLWLQNVPVLGK